MSRVNKTQFAILGCLSIRPMSAYDMKSFMARSTAYFWMEHEAQLYPTLKKLHQNGDIDCRKEKAKKSGVRNIYFLTDQGLETLRDWLMKKPGNLIYRNEFLLKIFFGDQVDKTVSIKHIDRYKEELMQDFRSLNEIETKLVSYPNEKRKPYIVAALSYGMHVLEAEMAWCDKARKLISESD